MIVEKNKFSTLHCLAGCNNNYVMTNNSSNKTENGIMISNAENI